MVPPSALLSRLFRVSRASDIDLHDIVRFLEADKALALRVLSVCNRLRQTERDELEAIPSLRRAIVMLGLEPVRDAVLAVSVYDSIEAARERAEAKARNDHESSTKSQRSPFVRSELDWAGLWRHTVAVACAAEQLAIALPAMHVQSSRAFVMGLMASTGKFALDIVLPESYTRVLALARMRLSSATQAETEVLGINNLEASAHLCTRWNLPDEDASAIGAIASAADPKTEQQVDAVAFILHCAQMIARSCHLGFSGEYDELTSPAKTHRFMGITEHLCDQITRKLPAIVAERAALLGIEEATDTELMIDAVGRANREIASHHEIADAHAEHAHRAMNVLASVTRTIERSSSSADIHAVAGSILEASGALFGSDDHTLFVRPTFGNAWIALRQNKDELTKHTHPIASRVLDIQHSSLQQDMTGWIELADPAMLGRLPISAAPWLSEMYQNDASARVMPLVFDSDTGCCALLVHKRAFDDAAKRVELLRALSTVWGSRIVAWSQMQQLQSQSSHHATSMVELTSMQDEIRSQSMLAELGKDTATVMEQVEMPVSVIAYRADQLAHATNDVHVESVARTICAAANEVSAVLELLRERTEKLAGDVGGEGSSASVAPQQAVRTTHTN